MKIGTCALALTAVLAITAPAIAHHGDSGVDMKTTVVYEGTVKEFAWKNPHVYFVMEMQRDGKTEKWEMQMAALSGLARRGWTATTLQPGDKVTVRAHPATPGHTYAIVESVTMAGGLRLAQVAKAPDVTPPAKTIAGQWLTDRASSKDYPGGFDGFFIAHLTPNEKGKTAQTAYKSISNDNPEASCVGRPTPAAIVSTGAYIMKIDLKPEQKLAVISSEWFNEVRTVYMDGRKHPDPKVRFVTGHSIGHWEGDTLVVDTANFADHRSPYQIGIPSGGQKHVVERYTLTKDGTHIDLDWMLEDPEYLTKPMTDHRQLVHVPHLQMYFAECDKESTSRFLSMGK
jgi:hypothetical protein